MDDTVKPTTTLEENRSAFAQRRVKLILEVTSSIIAVCVTCGVVFGAVVGINSEVLGNAFFLIVGFYFGRSALTPSVSIRRVEVAE